MNIFNNNIFYKNYNNDFKLPLFLKNISYNLINNDYIKYINLNIINFQINNKFFNINTNDNIKQNKNTYENLNNIIIEQNNNNNNEYNKNNEEYNDLKNNKNNEEYNDFNNTNNNLNNDDIFIVKKIYKKQEKNKTHDNSNKKKNILNNSNKTQNQLEIMNILFEKQLHTGIIKKPIQGDELKIEMQDFIDNCIMKSILRYDKIHSIYIMDIIKLKNNVANYNMNTNTKIKDNNHIIFYEQYNKWYEMNYTGIVKIDNTNKMLNTCLKKMKDKTKFRKDINNNKQLRGMKLTFIILNKITDLFYIKHN